MEYNKFITNCITLEKAVTLIKCNQDHSFIWFNVKNKKGCIFELGGRNLNGNLQLKAYIPKFEKGNYLVHLNGFVDHYYSIDNNGELAFGSYYVNPEKSMTTEDFLKFLNRKDFRKYTPKIKTETFIEKTYHHYYTYD